MHPAVTAASLIEKCGRIRRREHVPGRGQPCFCLCFGFSQITITRLPRLMILHFSHIRRTEARTFISHSLRSRLHVIPTAPFFTAIPVPSGPDPPITGCAVTAAHAATTGCCASTADHYLNR
jgi:hypothetical protein